jgi:hypothetical protein
MKYNFTNGTDTQKEQWRQAAHRLLHLPFDELPLSIEVTFVPSSSLNKQTTLAETNWSYGSSFSTTEVRNDAPTFGSLASLKAEAAALGLTWSTEKFYAETSVHELGHAAYAALPEDARIAIAKMFGAKSDDIEELSAPSKWQNRIIEGIAETFKEAFLPARHRVFPNRTNKKIAYSRFPEFRKLFRSYETMDGGEGGEGGGGWKPLPKADTARIGDDLHNDPLGFATPRVGLYDRYEWEGSPIGGVPTEPVHYIWGSRASSNWMGHANEKLEVRQPIVPPNMAFFAPTAEWAGGFTEGEPPAFGWVSWNAWQMSAFIVIRDAAGKDWSMEVSLQIIPEVEQKLFEFQTELKWWLVGLRKLPFQETPETLYGSSVLSIILDGWGVSGEEIFQAWEAKGQTITRNEDGSDVYFMRAGAFCACGNANLLAQVPPRRTIEAEPLEENMLELWARPLEATEEEGTKVSMTAPGGSLEPTGSKSGRHLHPVAS